MDPLSIACAILAFIGATTSTIKAARTLYKAPQELDSLLNDLTDAELMLRDVQAFLEEPIISLLDSQMMILQGRLAEAEAVLLELRAALGDLVNPSNSNKIRRYRWLKAKQRTRKLAKKLASIHSDLPSRMDQLGKRAFKMELESLSLTQSQMNSTLSNVLDIGNRTLTNIERTLTTRSPHEETHAAIAGLLQNTTTVIARLENILTRHEGALTFTAPLSPHKAAGEPSNTPQWDTTTPRSTHPSIMLNFRYHTPSFCDGSCGCSCHSNKSLATPTLLSSVLGKLLVGYRSIPLLTGACDSSHCKRNSRSAVFATYYFPQWWVASRMVMFSAKYTAGGPVVALRFPRRVPSTAPVFSMAQKCDIEGLQTLFRSGEASPLDIRDYRNSTTLLEVALKRAGLPLFKFLMSAGADPEVQVFDGRTIIEVACILMFRGTMQTPMQEWVAEQFLPKLLDYTQFPSLHETILGLRTTTVNAEMMKLASSVATINDLDVLGYTALAWAASRGDIASVAQLIEYGANPNVRSPYKVYALSESIRSGHINCALYLLEHGADPKVVDELDRTMLHMAVAFAGRHSSAIRLLDTLSQSGIDVNHIAGGINCLIVAIKVESHPHTIRWLLSHGADYKSPFGILIYLAWWANLEIVEVIRQASWSGLDVHAKGDIGCTAMEVLLGKDRVVPASPELVESFTQLLIEIEARTNNQVLEVEDDEAAASGLVLEDDQVSEGEDEMFHDSVEYHGNRETSSGCMEISV